MKKRLKLQSRLFEFVWNFWVSDLEFVWSLAILASEAVTGGVKEKDAEDEFTVFARVLAILTNKTWTN